MGFLRYIHPLVIAGALIAIMGITISYQEAEIKAWQVIVGLIGLEVWDFGWHSRAHHADHWTASIWVRLVGFSLAITACTSGIIAEKFLTS